MKSILMSIKPQYVAKILNGEKTIEIRKRFPSDYVGWVYIYCTKDNELLCQIDNEWNTIKVVRGAKLKSIYNGKIVARFWCDKVEDFWRLDNIMLAETCLTKEELNEYLQGNKGYAIHITKLEIFDKPREIKDFSVYSHTVSGIGFKGEEKQFKILKPLTRAPESYCYIEI